MLRGRERDHGRYRLAVMMGDDEIHDDTYKGEADALRQSAYLFQDFVSSGWTEIYRRDVASFG